MLIHWNDICYQSSIICISLEVLFQYFKHILVLCNLYFWEWVMYDQWIIIPVPDSWCELTSHPDILHMACQYHLDGLVQDYSISSLLVMEILQSCIKPSICVIGVETSTEDILRSFEFPGARERALRLHYKQQCAIKITNGAFSFVWSFSWIKFLPLIF